MDLWDAALLGGGAVAGFVNTVAGGGSALTFPLLMLAGLDASAANGTNRLAIVVQSTTAVTTYHRRGLRPWALTLAALPAALLGAGVGAGLAAYIPAQALERLFGLVFLTLAALMLARPRWLVPAVAADMVTRSPTVGGIGALFVVGLYGGVFQAGVGIPLLLVLVHAVRVDVISANAIKVGLVLVYTLLALAIFAWHGQVDWPRGVVLALGGILGSNVGARVNLTAGVGVIRAVVAGALLLAAAKTLGLFG